MTPHERTDVRINDLIGPKLQGLASKAPLFGVVGLVLCVLGLIFSPGTFLHSYLFAFMFWFGITLGSTAWLMGHHIVGGGWSFLLRRPLEAATRVWPWVLGMWFVLVAGMLLSMSNGHGALYEWADPKIVFGTEAAQFKDFDPILRAKSGYLNPLGWLIRGGLYFVIWMTLAHYLNKWSREEDVSSDPRARHRLNLLSGAGLLIYLITVTFASIDWVMSIEPHWYSALFGVIFLVGQGLSTLCVMIILVRRIAGQTSILKKVESRYFRDVGNLMLAFTLLWAYTNFSQFMIQYSANLAEEATWQIHRTQFGWQFFGFGNIVCHFALPFLFLLMSITKVNLGNLAKLAAFLILARHLDLFYYVVPTFRASPLDGLPGGAMPLAFLADIGAPLMLGGLWLTMWARQMLKVNAPIVPQFDERLDGFWPLDGEIAHSNGHKQEVITHG